jgi:hypothetical protein
MTEELFIDANAFSGELPGCLGNLFKLRRLFAFKNQLTGNVPKSILNLPNLGECNHLMFSIATFHSNEVFNICSYIQSQPSLVWKKMTSQEALTKRVLLISMEAWTFGPIVMNFKEVVIAVRSVALTVIVNVLKSSKA